MEKLDKAHVLYVAKEAYTSYDMYRRIVDMRKSLLPQNGQGSAGSRAMASDVVLPLEHCVGFPLKRKG